MSNLWDNLDPAAHFELEELVDARVQHALDNQWIPVEDRLPETEYRLWTYHSSYQGSKYVESNRFLPEDGVFFFYNDSVTHWMPIPKTPDHDTD